MVKNRMNKRAFLKEPSGRTGKGMNKRAQELSASTGLEWFIQNIVIVILLLIILGAGLYGMLRWLTG